MSTHSATHKRIGREFLDLDTSSLDRLDDERTFPLDPDDTYVRVSDDLGEEIAENFLLSATSGQSANQERTDEDELEEEMGGPFIETTVEQEVSLATDGPSSELLVDEDEEEPETLSMR